MADFDFIVESFESTMARINNWWKPGSESQSAVMHSDSAARPLMAAELEKGFFIRARNYVLKDETKFHGEIGGYSGASLFMFSLLLTPESFLLETEYDWPAKTKAVKKQDNIVFTSNNGGISFIVKAAVPVKALDLCFSGAWLLQQLPLEKRLKLREKLSPAETVKNVLYGALSVQQQMVINDMIDQITEKEVDILFLKSRALPLLNELIGNLVSGQSMVGNAAPANLAAIIAIEKEISSTLDHRIPDLKTIAKEHSMSESTLKRQFKKVYGRAVYEYHLFKKMEYAKKLLSRRNLSVSQVAYTLGYEKASSFIKVFKQQFGVSPGALRTAKDADES